MPTDMHLGFFEQLRMALERADRTGDAALNALIYGVMLILGASVALVAVGGLGGVIVWLLVWLMALVAAAMWIAPHFVEVQRAERRRAANERASVEAARRRAIDILLDDSLPEDERRAAAKLLIHGES